MLASAEEISDAELQIRAHDFMASHPRRFPPTWYDWQQEALFAIEPHVMTLAGNQTGKTYSATYQDALDLSGDYPGDWEGFKFDHQIDMTVFGVDNTQLVDVLQKELFGYIDPKTNKFTGGWIRSGEIEHFDRSQVAGLAKNVYVRSKFGTSKCALRAYTQSKTGSKSLPLAGTIKDVIHVDECPPDDIVGQLFMRTMNGNRGKGGRLRFTMTPELGVTNLVQKFMEDIEQGQLLVGPVAWDQCAHITPEKQQQILAGIPDHEKEMRSKGIPFFGSGLVYPIAENRIKCDPFEIPPHWRVIRAIDLGISHPTALVWLAYDPDLDTIYLVKSYAVKGENAATHASAANKLWPESPCIVPHDFDTTEKGSGEMVGKYYREAGLKRIRMFKNPDGSNHVEPGIFELYERMKDGRFKAFSTCDEFWKEFRMYHRDDGKRVKLHDDVMDAVRYGGIMISRYGVNPGGHLQKTQVKTSVRRRA